MLQLNQTMAQPIPVKHLKISRKFMMGTALMGLLVLALSFRRKKSNGASTGPDTPSTSVCARIVANEEQRNVMRELGRKGAQKRWADKREKDAQAASVADDAPVSA